MLPYCMFAIAANVLRRLRGHTIRYVLAFIEVLLSSQLLQGVIASGLAALSKATGNVTLLDQAEITLDATINFLTEDNILKENCDNVVPGGLVCNADQVRPCYLFVFAANLATTPSSANI